MANWFYRVLNNNELSPITELQRGGDERRGRGGPVEQANADGEKRRRRSRRRLFQGCCLSPPQSGDINENSK